MSAALQPPPLPPRDMTVEEFLEWADDLDGRWELRDGEPEMMAPPREAHGAIQSEAAYLLTDHLRRTGRPCRVVTTPGVIPRVFSDRSMLVPDLGVTCAPPSEGRDLPDPLALLEILSPSNAKRTRANLWAYASIPSVAEIVVVHSLRIAAEVLRRGPDGAWPEGPETVGPDGVLRVECVGFSVPLRDLYRTTTLAAGG